MSDIDKSQDIIQANLSKQSDVIISNPDGTASTTTVNNNVIRVRLGNSNPFLKAK